MDEHVITVDEVFGVSRDLPVNYVPRQYVDQVFVETLTRGNHIVIHGGSKQGKTSLRKYNLNASDYVLVQCSNKWSIADLHAHILKQAGFEVTSSTTTTASGKTKIQAKAPVLAWLAIGGELEKAKAEERVKAPLELDPDDVNDVIAALRSISFTKYVVLEDFHYLPHETQENFAISLKAFHEASKLVFIVIGVWLEKNRLILLNGDLTGRVLAVDADRWNREDLLEVMSLGEKHLNVEFDAAFKDELLGACRENVYIVQEACRIACRNAEVYQAQKHPTRVGQQLSVSNVLREIADQQSGRYRSFINLCAGGFQETQLQMYKWILKAVLDAAIDRLEKGLKYREIRDYLHVNHPDGLGLNSGNITLALQSIAALQVKKSIKPIVLDYDQSDRRLNVVDKGFLVWLPFQPGEDLRDFG